MTDLSPPPPPMLDPFGGQPITVGPTSALPAMGDPDDQQPLPPQGYPVLAWVMISLVAALVIFSNARGLPSEPGDATPPPTAHALHPQLVAFRIEARLLVGVSSLADDPNAPDQRDQQTQAILDNYKASTHPDIRVRLVTVLGELKNPDAALEQIAAVRHDAAAGQLSLGEHHRRQLELLELHYGHRREPMAKPALSDDQRTELVQGSTPEASDAPPPTGLGWFGQLALAPADHPNTAERSAVLRSPQMLMAAMMVVVLGGLLGLLAGTVLLIVFAVGWLSSHWTMTLKTGSPHGGIYAETFAVWMVLYVSLSVAGELVGRHISGAWPMVMTSGAMLASLAALAWPVMRGIAWSTVKADLGLSVANRHPLIEAAWGLVGYVGSWPLLLVGVVIMLIMTALAVVLGLASPDGENQSLPGHPIMEELGGHAPQIWAVLLAVAVVAPIVEEVMFRGVLYRHLREVPILGRLGAVGGAVAAAVLSGLLFASLHPQGVLGIPVLTALAVGFALMREWRGHLMAPMMAHASHNLIVTLIAVTVLAS